jgi:hypothetical protein
MSGNHMRPFNANACKLPIKIPSKKQPGRNLTPLPFFSLSPFERGEGVGGSVKLRLNNLLPATSCGRCEREARRAGIFVETRHKYYKAPSGATSSEYAATPGLKIMFGLWFYKDAAPMALGTCSVGAVRRKVRATGSTLQTHSECRMGNGRT